MTQIPAASLTLRIRLNVFARKSQIRTIRNLRPKRQLFFRKEAPVYRLMIKMFDQMKNSRHDLLIADVGWLF